jgi:hypothetical protein
MVYDVILPPEELGPIGKIVIPRSSTIGDAYDKVLGAMSFTVNVNVVVVDPPEFVAVMVYVVTVFNSTGVPEIVPVAGSNTKPPGKLGLML